MKFLTLLVLEPPSSIEVIYMFLLTALTSRQMSLQSACATEIWAPVLLPACELLSMGVAVVFGTLLGRLEVASDFEAVWVLPLSLLVVVRDWVTVGIAVFAE